MTKEYGYYDDIDSTINSMLSSIENWRTKKININSNRLYLFEATPVSITRTQLNFFSHAITTTNELLDDYSIGKEFEVENKLTEALSSNPSFQKLQFSGVSTINRKRVILRNAIAHAEFKIIEEENEWYIKFNHKNMTGELTIADLTTIYGKIDAIRVDYERQIKNSSQKTVQEIGELILLKVNNKEKLKEVIDKIYIQSSDNFITHKRKLTNEEKELFYAYINYIGLNNWIQMPRSLKTELAVEMLVNPFVLKNIFFPKTYEYVTIPLLNAANLPIAKESIGNLYYESPIAFTQNLLNTCFFVFNYMQEATKKDPIQNFNSKDISIPCKILFPTPNNTQHATATKKKISEIDKLMEKLQEKIDNPHLSKNTTLLESLKQQKLMLNIERRKLYAKKDQINTITNWHDSDELIRHIRNSISHGFYSINYLPGLQTKDLNKVIFHIEDYKVNKETRDKTKTFECEITAAALIKLIKLYSMKFSSKTIIDTTRPVLIYNNVRPDNPQLVTRGNKKAIEAVESRSNAFRI